MDVLKLPSIMIGIFVTIFFATLLIDIGMDIYNSTKCEKKFPNEDFCDLVTEGQECGSKCKELNLEFFYFDRGGFFSNDKCSCKNIATNDIVILY